MKLGFSLYLQTLCWLGLYIATLLLLMFVFFNSRWGIGWEALVKSPLGVRVENITNAISGQLSSSEPERWGEILENFGNIYHVNFYVFDSLGREVVGQPVQLPPAVLKRVREFPPPLPRMGMPGFPPPGPVSPLMDPNQLPPPPHMRGAPLMHAHERFIVRTENPDHFWVGTRFDLRDPQFHHPMPVLLLASSENLWQSTLLCDFNYVGWSFAFVISLSVLFWFPFIYRITSSLSELTLATEQIADGHFDVRLKENRRDEIGMLSEMVNQMARRLNNFVTGQKRFLGDISHELYSPLARLHVALELIDGSDPEEQKDLIEDIREEVKEMNSLVNELIAYSKAGLKEKQPELCNVNLRTLLDALLGRLDAQSKVELEVPDDTFVLADQLLLDRAISNIVRNGVRYAGDEGPITVKAATRGHDVYIVIADKGPGVPEQALEHLGEPFFRPEPSRNRSSGGTGLGLAIVKSCVGACGGSLHLRNRQPHGLEVEVRLKAGQA